MQNPPPVQTAPAKSSTGLDENLAALLSYVAGWLSGLIFFLMEKDSRLVRFHGMQSLLWSGALMVVSIALVVLSLISGVVVSQVSGILSFLLSLVAWLAIFVLVVAYLIGVVMCLIKAYQGQYFKLPFIGNLAEKFSTK